MKSDLVIRDIELNKLIDTSLLDISKLILGLKSVIHSTEIGMSISKSSVYFITDFGIILEQDYVNKILWVDSLTIWQFVSTILNTDDYDNIKKMIEYIINDKIHGITIDETEYGHLPMGSINKEDVKKLKIMEISNTEIIELNKSIRKYDGENPFILSLQKELRRKNKYAQYINHKNRKYKRLSDAQYNVAKSILN